eukprot:TRINITY_DN12643_c0_g1_i1.p1 TRINITY_DN12643_c0_g1~~TRINITY_DN12643_c0_g1_i1.p1  ORF type:complete len:205 (+),score=36.69 TRINITY_DN12643_c0_g1_i1:29-643(+)
MIEIAIICVFVFLAWVVIRLSKRFSGSPSFGFKYDIPIPPEPIKSYLKAKNTPEATTEQVRTLLFRRAINIVPCVMKLQKEFGEMKHLHMSNCIPGDSFRQVQEVEHKILSELREVQNEAEFFKTGWGRTIINEAAKVYSHVLEKQRQKEAEMQKKQDIVKHEKTVAAQKRHLESLHRDKLEKNKRKSKRMLAALLAETSKNRH